MRRVYMATVGVVFVTGVGFALAQAPAKKAPPAPAPSSGAAVTAPTAKLTYPPIPNPGFAAGRPIDQARAVYQFAAEHPEVLKYVPCYCGCETSGHPHNESCFVKRRDARGNVTEWDMHGYG